MGARRHGGCARDGRSERESRPPSNGGTAARRARTCRPPVVYRTSVCGTVACPSPADPQRAPGHAKLQARKRRAEVGAPGSGVEHGLDARVELDREARPRGGCRQTGKGRAEPLRERLPGRWHPERRDDAVQQPRCALIGRDPEPDDQPPPAERVAERRQQHGRIRDAGGEHGGAVDLAREPPGDLRRQRQREAEAALDRAAHGAELRRECSRLGPALLVVLDEDSRAPPPELPVRVDPEAGRLLRVGRPDAEQVRALPQQRDLARPGHRGDERDLWIAPRDLAEDDAVTGPRSADDDVGVLVFDESPRGRDHRRELAALVASDQEPGAAAAGQSRLGDAVRGFGRTEVRAAVEKRQLGACEHQILVAAEEAGAIDDHADAQRRRAGGERGREARCGGEGCCHEEDRPTTHRT